MPSVVESPVQNAGSVPLSSQPETDSFKIVDHLTKENIMLIKQVENLLKQREK